MATSHHDPGSYGRDVDGTKCLQHVLASSSNRPKHPHATGDRGSTTASCLACARTAHVCTHVCTHVYIHVCTHVYAYVYAHVYTHVHVHADAHVYTHVYTHVCPHVYTHFSMSRLSLSTAGRWIAALFRMLPSAWQHGAAVGPTHVQQAAWRSTQPSPTNTPSAKERRCRCGPVADCCKRRRALWRGRNHR